jgi:hypothetical protein
VADPGPLQEAADDRRLTALYDVGDDLHLRGDGVDRCTDQTRKHTGGAVREVVGGHRRDLLRIGRGEDVPTATVAVDVDEPRDQHADPVRCLTAPAGPRADVAEQPVADLDHTVVEHLGGCDDRAGQHGARVAHVSAFHPSWASIAAPTTPAREP